jgi:hypothetical protein
MELINQAMEAFETVIDTLHENKEKIVDLVKTGMEIAGIINPENE